MYEGLVQISTGSGFLLTISPCVPFVLTSTYEPFAGPDRMRRCTLPSSILCTSTVPFAQIFTVPAPISPSGISLSSGGGSLPAARG